MRFNCSKDKDDYKQFDCTKARNLMLLDFVQFPRNTFMFFRSSVSNMGMLHWTWWLL